MLFSRIAKIVNGHIEQLHSNLIVKDLLTDSRQVASGPDALFVCLKGSQHDGHEFVREVFQKGITNFLISSNTDLPESANAIKVGDTVAALQKLGAFHRSRFSYPVIGITGSNGKTMVKEWLGTVLQEKFKVVKSPKSYNSQIGVPLSVWQMQDTHDIAIFEAGISKKGEMQKLAEIIRPTIGIFTNIGEAHSEGFESIDQKIEEKAILFSGAEKIICCRDHRMIYEYLSVTYPGKVISWSEELHSDIQIRRNGQLIDYLYRSEQFTFKISLQAPENLENLHHVIAASIVCGLNQIQIEQGLKNIVPVPMRLELKRGANDTYLLDDTYNNDLAGLRIALNYQKQQTQYIRKTVILSDMLQAGQPHNELYREVNALLKKHEVNRFIGIGDRITASKDIFRMEKYFFPDVEAFLSADLSFASEMIIVKGARSFGLEKIVAFLEEKNHGTVLEVNFEALTHNLNTYRKYLKPDVKLMVMVKAFAYGGGIAEIANLLQYQQIDRLGVAYVDEGIFLRKHGIRTPILVMNPNWDALSLLTTFGLEAEVYSLEMLSHMLKNLNKLPPIHLKIETGMNRLGIQEADIDDLIQILSNHPDFTVTGVFTHLSSQEDPKNDDYTREQVKQFNRIFERISAALGYRPVRHLLNSAGIVRWPEYQYEMVRLGIGLYGFDAAGTVDSLQPISTLKSVISQVKPVRKGESIGYSRSGIAKKDGRIAILPIGYADGYLRVFGNGRAYVMINGKKAPTIGNICMDMTMVDITGIEAMAGDEVLLFGKDPSIVDLAKWANTIPYEILTNISQRVKRVFRSE